MTTKLNFRKLRADEIEVRIGFCSKKGVSLLLYKDARCDMNILDESVGALNWQRHHTRDNANCIVAIWDVEKMQWIEKEDTGKESFAEKEKGLASDSFKRACFAWGIGRELYTAPFLWFPAEDCNITEVSDTKSDTKKPQCNDCFQVTEISYAGEKIASVTVLNKKTKVSKIFKNTTAASSETPAETTVPKKTTAKKECKKESSPASKTPRTNKALESATENPGAHKISFECSRKGKSIEEIYKAGGKTFLNQCVKYAASNEDMRPDAPYIEAYLASIA